MTLIVLIYTQNTGKSANDILKIGSSISNRDGYVGGNDIKSAYIQLLPSDVLLAHHHAVRLSAASCSDVIPKLGYKVIPPSTK